MVRSSPHAANGLVHALLYRRVSGAEHQKEGLSLAAQEKITRTYAARPNWVVAGEFEDIMSGRKADRPQYQRMLDQVSELRRQHKDAAVVVVRLDRLGRNKREYFRAEDELAKLGAEVHSVKDGGVLDPTHAGILAVFAADEARRIGERVAETRSELVNQGYHYGRTPFGYRKRAATPEEAQNGRKVVMEPIAVQAEIVQAIFERVAEGESVERAAKWLASLPPEQRGHKLWPSQCVAALLRSPSYVARPSEGDEDILARPKARWQPLVTDEVFARVQARFTSHQRRPHQASGQYLLTGFLRCPRCGQRMVALTFDRSDKPRRDGSVARRQHYRCTGWSRGANGGGEQCRYTVPMAQSDCSVTEQVAAVLGILARLDQPTLQARLQREFDAQQAPGTNGSQERTLRKAERDIHQAQERLGKAAIALMDGTLDQIGYAALRDQVTADLSRAEEVQTRLLAQTHRPRAAHDLGQARAVLAQAGGWAKLFEGAGVVERRGVLDRLVEQARITRAGYRQYAAEIDWTPEGKLLLAVSETATR